MAWVHSRRRLVESLFTVSWDCHFNKFLFLQLKIDKEFIGYNRNHDSNHLQLSHENLSIPFLLY